MEKLNLQEVMTAISGHYKDPTGNHPAADLGAIMALPQFQERYARAMKQANGDGRAATTSALYGMLQFRETVHELNVHVIEPDDYDMDWPKGGKPSVQTTDKQPPAPDGSNVARGVRIVLPDGGDRFLTGVPADVRAGLHRGQPVKMVGDITVGVDLAKKVRGERWQTIRLGKSDLKVEAHGEPMPKSGLFSFERSFGKSTRFGGDGKVLPMAKWKGAYRLDNRTNTIQCKFGPEEKDARPFDFQLRAICTVKEATYSDFDEDRTVVRLVVEDDQGNRCNIKESPEVVATLFGIPADGDYSPLVGERIIASGRGSIDAIIEPSSIGNFEAEVADLLQKGLLAKQSKGDGLQLAFSDAHVAAWDAEAARTGVPVVPHIIVGDKRVVSMYQQRDGDWKVNGLCFDLGRNPWMTCLPDRRGGNKTGSITWLSRVGGKLSYDASDPLYAALANIPLQG